MQEVALRQELVQLVELRRGSRGLDGHEGLRAYLDLVGKTCQGAFVGFETAFISLSVMSSWKAGGTSPLSSSLPAWASGAAYGMVIT